MRTASLATALLVVGATAQAAEVNVYTYREPGLIKPLFDRFTAETGVKVNTIFANAGLEERIAAEGATSPADLLLTVDIARLTNAVNLGVSQPVQSAVLEKAVPAQFRDPSGHWFGITYRARVIYAAKDRVPQGAITYEELADPKWKGKICIRDGQHIYNVALFAAGVVHMGTQKAETWISGIKDNLARKPSGGDREVARDIAAGQCDIGLGNNYYVGLMRNREPDRKPWADAIKVILPTFKDGGTHINVSGFIVAKHAPNRDAALKLAEWLVGEAAQKIYAEQNYEYPILPGVPLDATVASFGALKPDTIPIAEIAKARKVASEIVEKTGFNAGPRS